MHKRFNSLVQPQLEKNGKSMTRLLFGRQSDWPCLCCLPCALVVSAAPCGHAAAPMGRGGPVPLGVPKQGGSGVVQPGVLLLCQPCTADARLLEPTWLLACGCSSQRRRWHFSHFSLWPGLRGSPWVPCSGIASPSDPALCQCPFWSHSKIVSCWRVRSAGGTPGLRWPGTGRALHSGPLPRREVPAPWMEQSMPRHDPGQHVGRGAEADPASKADVTGESQPWCVTAG